jgi:hypothetical protein
VKYSLVDVVEETKKGFGQTSLSPTVRGGNSLRLLLLPVFDRLRHPTPTQSQTRATVNRLPEIPHCIVSIDFERPSLSSKDEG